jgi:hypothetical protein
MLTCGMQTLTMYFVAPLITPHPQHRLPDADLLLHSFDWESWRNTTPTVPPQPPATAPLSERVQWLQGEPLPRLDGVGCSPEASEDYLETLLLHGTPFVAIRSG